MNQLFKEGRSRIGDSKCPIQTLNSNAPCMATLTASEQLIRKSFAPVEVPVC